MSGDSKKQAPADNRVYFVTGGNKVTYLLAFVIGACSLVIVALFWYQLPSYAVLMKGVDATRLAMAVAELQHSNIAYQYDPASSNLLVSERDLEQARMVLLMTQPRTSANTISSRLSGDNVAGALNYSESGANSAFYSLETELAKTIASIDNVQSARVHLAISNGQESKRSSASIVVRLVSGRRLTDTQISSISHLVAASTTNLSLENITIVDQSGRLLISAGSIPAQITTSSDLENARHIEQYYIERIENILAPILDNSAMRVQVTADIDVGMKRKENPLDESGSNEGEHASALAVNKVRRLSIALVIDHKFVTRGDGQVVKIPRTRKELQNITELAKKAVGFDGKRGDSINVINESFNALPGLAGDSNNANWNQAEVLDAIKVISVIILLVGFSVYLFRKLANRLTVFKPILNTNNYGSENEPEIIPENKSEAIASANNMYTSTDMVGNKFLYEQLIEKTQKLIHQDSEQVAQVLKSWVREDGK